MTYRHSFVLGLIITTSLICTSQTVWGASEVSTYSKTDFAMDTVVSETLYTTGRDITADVIDALKDVEQNWISWTQESSQIYQINQNAGSTVTVSDETAGYLKQVLDLSKASDGAMDPTMGKVIRLWDIDGENPHIPNEDELNSLLENVGYEKVTLDGNEVTMPEGVTLDLGAAGKGIGCDAAKQVLENHEEVSGMILNLGGSSVMSYGSKPDGSSWQVAVTDPRDTEGDYLGVVTLNGTEFLSTSGDYEKYFIEDGVRYHHILDPSTGYPARSGLTSVTVVCNDGLNADGLSTTCFVLGKDKAAKLLEKYNADGLFVDDSGHVWLTDGMKERFQLLKDTYSVNE
ncbi:FAD:protein FMN transferase [Ruminococcus sp. AF37-6AT]|jgi:thiamine biosynthesis lipoprotein|nr:FAD:protein FMN transferase [Ruminococcus sp. AM07-21]RHL51955.1 FAD:protein FMN transferase [Ruminococcus sp. AF37-6AT]RHP59770.1 FAD:protein FMN transferase [Ruminococcus sp. AF31-16BH]